MIPAPNPGDKPWHERRMLLATDLDGTFLGGSDDDRRALYDLIAAHRDDVALVFVTGRDPEFITDLCAEGFVPWPDLLIGDVGTTIASVHPGSNTPVRPVAVLEADIAERWGNSGARVRKALEGAPGLTLQPTAFRYRVSYDLDADLHDPATEAMIREMGFDVIVSANRFFDVLPSGISKGPSLRKLVSHLGVPEERVLAAGDTLNDLSMLACGLNAVAVGGSEQKLIDQVRHLPTVYKAAGIGTAGITEAIAVFGLLPIEKGITNAL
ncbi:hydroxymethylpyrimidine pyrophosphatase-like HAD family hydrolase [Hoeflea marina]|uniref:Hydroxymethylpyrimidine pyrophosphatase-like HAD family hydrolase n=1 Tax=Hoeflea marina TaxID=274592 RepID=A0A317PPV6_9HYPH|nr:HAD family hydrolase [Hoeflea marina]PWW03483.1 hydroxymethylpyrimidine pyrophosphatase-like HAD family hydrolase [Hoeflea marina]